jgi:hypothetical protein
MTQIQNSKYMIRQHLGQMASSAADKGFGGDTVQLR